MHGLGTIVNVAAIVVGGLAGLLGGRRIPERLQKTLMSAMGVSVLFVGVSGALSQMLRAEGGALTVQGTMMMILSLAVGADRIPCPACAQKSRSRPSNSCRRNNAASQ